MQNTTIKITRKTKQRLDNLKEYKRESYEDVIIKILHILNQIRKDPISGNRLLGKIDGNIVRGRSYFKEKEKDLINKNSKTDNK